MYPLPETETVVEKKEEQEDAVEETQSMIGLQSWVIGDIIEGGMI